MNPIMEDTFRRGIDAHSSGQLQEAARLYSSILKAYPKHAGANHNIGTLSVAADHLDESIPFFKIALESDPYVEQYWISYISVLIRLGRTGDANRAIKKAKKKNLRKSIISQLKSKINQKTVAVGVSIQQDPPLDKVQHLVALLQNRQLQEAVMTSIQLIKTFSSSALLFNIQGVIYEKSAQFEKAVASFEKAIEIKPDYPDPLSNMGNTLKAMGDMDGAIEMYNQALKIEPNHFESHYNMANLLYRRNDFEKAIRWFLNAIEINKDFSEAHNNLGMAHEGNQDIESALASYKEAIRISPEFPDALHNMANLLRKEGDRDGAEEFYKKALVIKPDFPEASMNLGNVLYDAGSFEQAMHYYMAALELRPNYDGAFSNMLFCKITNPLESDESIFNSHCMFADIFENPLKKFWPVHENLPDHNRRLNIGFVSGDFRDHPIADFFEPVIKTLDTMGNYSLHAYNNSDIESKRTDDIRQYFGYWTNVANFSDEVLTSKIMQDGIDILIDLSGHTAGNRLLVFARKPAPVQASWMGYPGTTGLNAIDYFIGPSFSLPFGEFDHQFSEKILGLPLPLPYTPKVDFPPVNELPALKNGYITFGSFFRSTKISRAVVSVWASLIRNVPHSRLLIGAMEGDQDCEKFIVWFKEEAISPDRFRFENRTSLDKYYLLHNEIDIHLAPFPYIGGTTIAAAIQMGVPTLAISGKRLTSRGGAASMYYIGHPEFIANNKAEFIANGVRLSSQLEVLAKTRESLREKTTSSLFYDPNYMQAVLDKAFQKIWHRWCDGLDPVAYDVRLEE